MGTHPQRTHTRCGHPLWRHTRCGDTRCGDTPAVRHPLWKHIFVMAYPLMLHAASDLLMSAVAGRDLLIAGRVGRSQVVEYPQRHHCHAVSAPTSPVHYLRSVCPCITCALPVQCLPVHQLCTTCAVSTRASAVHYLCSVCPYITCALPVQCGSPLHNCPYMPLQCLPVPYWSLFRPRIGAMRQ